MSNNFLIGALFPDPHPRMSAEHDGSAVNPSRQVPIHTDTPIRQHPIILTISYYQSVPVALAEAPSAAVAVYAPEKKSLAAVGLSSFAPKRKPRRNSGVDKAS